MILLLNKSSKHFAYKFDIAPNKIYFKKTKRLQQVIFPGASILLPNKNSYHDVNEFSNYKLKMKNQLKFSQAMRNTS